MLSVDIVFLNVFLAASGCISALKIIDVAIAYSGPVSFAEFVCFSQGYTPSLRLEQDEKRDFRQIRVSGISTMLRGLLKNLAARLLVPFLMDPSLIDDLPITEWLLYHYFSGWFLYLIASQIGDVVFGAMQAASAVPMLDMFNAPYFSTRFDFSPKFIAISIQPARFLVPPMEQAGFPLFPSDYLSVQTSKCWLVKWLFCHAVGQCMVFFFTIPFTRPCEEWINYTSLGTKVLGENMIFFLGTGAVTVLQVGLENVVKSSKSLQKAWELVAFFTLMSPFFMKPYIHSPFFMSNAFGFIGIFYPWIRVKDV
ncbi:MAG: hypothetical protein SGCHY_004978 [Lobulomycetales sp.]